MKGRGFSPHTWTNGIGFYINWNMVLADPDNRLPLEYPLEEPSWIPELREGIIAPIVPDKDAVGLAHARQVHASVAPLALETRWLELPGGKDASDKVYEHKVSRISKIKSRADEDDDKDEASVAKRPVIDLEMCLGDVKRTVEVNLTDRSSFNYPLLIGAKALREFGAAVNPARRYTADKPDC